MNKLILLVKRKKGTTHEEFRQHYINSHAPLARANLPHLRKYVRNFLTAMPGQPEPAYDCVTEFWFDDRAGLDASTAFAQSAEGQILAEDEERFMDRSSMLCYFAEEHEN
jgi:uncharacterized protein (TIGR02118 family)